ncbi:MAG: peptidoglycan DD-metalloendopeptidase family protein [Sphaerochaetaceae bacterium]
MGFKEKSSYDDMRSNPHKWQGAEYADPKGRKVVVAVVLVGVVLCAAVIIVWLRFFPSVDVKASTPVSTLIVDTKVENTATMNGLPGQSPTINGEPSPSVPIQPVASDALVRANSSGGPVAGVVTPVPEAVPSKPKAASTIVFTRYTVKEGDTLDTIATVHEISKETIISVNPIKNLSSIKTGELLTIPDRNGQLYTVQPGDSLSIITNRFNPGLGWKTLQDINGLDTEVIHPGQKIFIPSAVMDADGSFSNYIRFMQPAKGRITGLYGQTVKYGETEEVGVLQGIWIEGATGSQIVASGTGVVVDAGNDMEKYGRFVVLSHADGYRTTYAHLEDVNVKVGDQIKQGDLLGTMGSTGKIGKTTLYFSLEQEGTALNPENFF